MKINVLTNLFLFTAILYGFAAHAESIEKNTARMQAMDKITGRVSMINVPVNGEVKFGSLSIVARSCKTRPAEEAPDNFAFIDVTDTSPEGVTENIFKGWMISSSPATHAVEHPIYDVWLLQCLDTKTDKKLLLSEQELAVRDTLPMQASSSKTEEKTIETEETETSEPIEEMTAENKPENTEAEMLLPEEFSFDEDEETIMTTEDKIKEITSPSEETDIPSDDISAD